MAKPKPVRNKPKCTSIDPINYREVKIETQFGPQLLKGITVRALRKALEDADPDMLVTYMAEQNGGILFGVIGGTVHTEKFVAIVGPEATRGFKAMGWWNPTEGDGQ